MGLTKLSLELFELAGVSYCRVGQSNQIEMHLENLTYSFLLVEWVSQEDFQVLFFEAVIFLFVW